MNNRNQLELMHITPCEEAPQAMCGFHGRVVVAVGRLEGEADYNPTIRTLQFAFKDVDKHFKHQISGDESISKTSKKKAIDRFREDAASFQ